MTEPTASITLLGRRAPEEQAFEIQLTIGPPYQVGDQPHEWACPIGLTPLYKNLRDASASDSLQALCLAMSLALDLLSGFREKGGELMYESGEQFPLDAYCFGTALGNRKPA